MNQNETPRKDQPAVPVATTLADYWFDTEKREQHLVRSLVRPGMTVFDVGAHIGRYTRLFSLATGKEGRVFAFEPTPTTLGKLARAIREESLDNVELVRAAVSDQAGTTVLHVFPEEYSTWNGLGRPRMEDPKDSSKFVPIAAEVPVPMIRLDEFCKSRGIDRIDYLKLDVEGVEYRALLGLEALLKKQAIGALQFEVSKKMLEGLNTTATPVFKLLNKHGYRCHRIGEHGEVGPEVSDSDAFFENYIALPSMAAATASSQAARPAQPAAARGPKFSFVTIVLNGMPFLEQALKAAYDFAHEIIVVEGAVENCRFAAHADGSSTDGTVECIRRFPDPLGKVRFIQGAWPEKCEMQNAALPHVTGDYVWLMDSDEIYRAEDLRKIRDLVAAEPSITQINVIPDNFWKGFDHLMVAPYFFNPEAHYRRIFKFVPGAQFTSHRPPALQWPGEARTTEQMSCVPGEITRAMGVIPFHYSYVVESQVAQKIELYNRYGWGKHWNLDMNAWFRDCWQAWTPENRLAIEALWPVWTGGKGSRTVPFTGEHPEVMRDFIRNFRLTAGSPKKAVPQLDKELAHRVIGSPDWQRRTLAGWQHIQLDAPLIRRRGVIEASAAAGKTFWNNHVTLGFLASRLNVRTYLEVGVRSGGSMVQVLTHGPVEVAVGVDLWSGQYADLPNTKEFTEGQLKRHRDGTGGQYELHLFQGNSHDVLKQFVADGLKFDMVNVDGDHTDEGALEDLEDALKLLAPRGAIMFDDIIHPVHLSLLDVVDKFARAHPELELLINDRDDNGVAVLLRGISVRELLGATADPAPKQVPQSQAAPVPARKARLKVAEDYAHNQDLTKIDGGSEFASAIRNAFRIFQPRRIVETGTYLGTGTTRVIAETLKELGIKDAFFHSIEVNPEHFRQARKNLEQAGLADYVHVHHGLSVPRRMLPDVHAIEQTTVVDPANQDIFVDHRQGDRAKRYHAETDFSGVPDDLLGRALRAFEGRPDFVLLDSAGHMGFVEFQYLISQLNWPCLLALDDINHIKHHRSLEFIRQDGRFEIIVESDEKFGFCLARFAPARIAESDNSVQKLLWVRTDSIGDAVLSSGMLPLIRQKYPQAEIAVVCKAHVAGVYANNPDVRQVICFEAGKPAAGILAELSEDIRAFAPQLVLNSTFSRDDISVAITHLAGSAARIAIEADLSNLSAAARAAEGGKYSKLIRSEAAQASELVRHRDFLAGLGVEVDVVAPVIWTSQDEEAVADDFFAGQKIDSSRAIAVFPGAQHECRVYAGYAEALARFQDHSFLIFGDASQSALSEELAKGLGGRAWNLCGKSSITETAALVRRCRLYVGAESAGAHIACAMGVPNVVLLGGGHFGRFMPYSALTSAVALPMDCYGCNWNCRHSRALCVKDVDPALLAEAVRQTLARSSVHPRIFVSGEASTEATEAALKRQISGRTVEFVTVGNGATANRPSAELGGRLKDLEAALAAEDFAGAESILSAAHREYPDNGELCQALANLQFQMGRFAQAIPSFKAAGRLAPQDPLIPVLLAHCHLNIEDVEGFEAAIAQSFEIQPGNSHALRLVGDVNFRFGRHADAARAYGALVNQGESDVEVMLGLGRCFEEIGQLPGAHACFTEVIRRQPAHSEANRLLAALEQRIRRAGAPVPVHQNQADHEQVPCPACGSRVANAVRTRADIVQCGDCQTVYLRTRMTKDAMRRLYQSYADDGSHMALPKSIEEAEKSGLARNYLLKEILTFIEPSGEFLDVGCGWGGFLLNARKHGFKPRGIELTRRCVGYARDSLGIPVVETQLEETDVPPGSLSVVTMNHVLEHLPEPAKALGKVIDFLKPGGMYCGIVPNFQSACSTSEGENWYWLDPFYHYTHFTPATLRRFLEAAGFIVERLYTATGDYGAENVRKGCLKADAKLADDDYFKAEVQRYEAEGRGEEIRFFARKPSLVKTTPAPAIVGGQGITVPVVSVIVSTYNSEKFIRPCLENLTRQTLFPQVEVIVVDSGSDQNESAIVAEFARKHPNIRYVRTERETLYGAWNRGLAEARGRYWVNANTDDALRDDALEMLVKAMDANASAQIAYSDCVWTSTPNDTFPSKTLLREVRYPDYVPIHSLFYCITGCLQFWRVADLRAMGGFDATLKAAGDYEIMTRLLRRGGSALHVGELLSLFFQNTRGISQADDRSDKEHAAVTASLRKDLDISRVFQCRPEVPNDQALAWTALAISALHFTVPWEDKPFSQHEYSLVCLEKAVQADENCSEAWQTLAGFVTQIGQASEFEGRLKGRWPQVVGHLRRAREAVAYVIPELAHAVDGPSFELASNAAAIPGLELEPAEIRPWVARREGRFSYLSHKLIPRSKGVTYTPSELKEAGARLFAVLEKFPAFCAHFGGAGDGLLLMAATFDRDPKMPVVSYPNSHRSAVAFFEAFPAGGQVYLLPLSGDPQVHIILRWVMKGLRTCTNAGATPKDGYADEWKPGLDIAKKYGINLSAKWAAAFINNTSSRRIAIAPQGSLAGMVGSKRNIIDRSIWSLLLGHVKAAGYVPVVVGTPDEASDYPAGEGCVDARSRSFRSQMEEIGRCVGLVGADSWAKTFSALAGLATIVFEPIKGPDLKGWADPADNVFIKPWPLIRMVKDLAEFETSFDHLFPRNSAEVASSSQAIASGGGLAVSWEGSFLDLGSLSHVNRALTDLLAADRRFALSCVGGNSIPVSMRNDPDWKRRAKALLAEPAGKAAVTVRHQWPPDWSRPAAGALVVIQPWEFGSLPKEWVAAAKDVDEFWAPSEYVRQVYISSGVDAAKVRVVPNGVDTDLYRPDAKPRALKTKKRFKLLFVGATIGRKGPDVLLQSYLATFTAADDVCLVVKDFGGDTVYTGQTIGALIEKAASQPNAPEILYLDEEIPPAEMPGLFSACDCLVHPYRGEGFGMPILEAMACGLPVVVTKGGAADDFVGEANGWLIRSQRRSIGNEVSKIPLVGDGWLLEPDASHLSAILREVVADPTHAKAKGRAGALVAHKKYGWPTIAGIVANRLVEVGGRKPVGPLAGTGKRKPAMARIVLPPCALLGHIGNAAELLRQNKFRPAWKAACVALDERPFNPPAWEIMGEIAAAAGDYKLAKTCLEALRAIVPGWKNVKELTRLLMGKAGGKPSGFLVPSKPDAPRISVCLIARNEERFLEQCLSSVKELAWEIIVVDTGSTDRTIEIAKGFGARIGGFTWCDDFAAARNAAMEMVRGDWVLILDADEVVRSESLRHLKNELADAAALAWRIPLFNVGKENTGSCVVPRLFRNAPALFYVGRVHEQIFTSVEVRRQEWGMETKLGRTELLHYGYTEEMTRDRNKIERNLKLLEQAVEEIPGDANLIFNLGMEKVRMGRIEEGLVHYREAIQVLNGTPADQIVPELREVCLTQFLGILKEARKFHELAETLHLPIMSRGAITASMHYLLGFALVQLGRSGDAAKHLLSCIGLRNERTLAPIHSDLLTAAPHHCLAVALANLNRPDEAEAAFDRAKAEAPLSAAVMLDYARFEAARGETAKALHLLHVVLGTDPKHSMLWRFGAQILLQKPELGEIGDQWTSEALNHFPADRELLSARGEILLLTGHANEAATLLEQAAKAGGPRLVAADAVCRLVNGGAPSAPVTDTETTREFLVWYRRLVQWQASGVVGALNEALPRIEVSLPKAGAVIRSVLAEAAA